MRANPVQGAGDRSPFVWAEGNVIPLALSMRGQIEKKDGITEPPLKICPTNHGQAIGVNSVYD
jgi:hypothetical protein